MLYHLQVYQSEKLLYLKVISTNFLYKNLQGIKKRDTYYYHFLF